MSLLENLFWAKKHIYILSYYDTDHVKSTAFGQST